MQNDPAISELKRLPAVSTVLGSHAFVPLAERHGLPLVTDLLRETLDALRREVVAGRLAGAELERAVAASALAREVTRAAESLTAPRPRTVINATGVVLHTNLGRAALSEAAAEQLAAAARGYLDLEYDLETGSRGSRLAHLAPLMGRLFPGHGFAVFNNNAAAVLLCLRALSLGREALISRGELVEIGGSFRIPDILAASGAVLREVGTTNRTRLADYEKAASPATGLILKVHTSNFRIVGFTEETSIGELAGLARRLGLPLVVDWGSGNLVDLEPAGIRDEPPVQRILSEGADLVSFSGDKLLGGPQSGFVVGRPELVERVRREPLARACRLDRTLVGALQQTLAAHATGRALEELPTLRMLSLEPDALEPRAARIRQEVAARAGQGWRIVVVDGVSRTGGGSSPQGERPTRLVAISRLEGDASPVERRLRGGEPPVIGRLQDGRLLLDPRTVLPEQDRLLIARLIEALAEEPAGT